MTDAEKRMKCYMNRVERRLSMPSELRTRVMNDLVSSVAARREAGQSDEEILAELGSPAKAARELNEQMKEYARPKSRWRFLCWGLVIAGGAWLVAKAASELLGLLLTLWYGLGPNSIAVIGGADGPTAIFVTASDELRNLAAVAALLVGILGLCFLRWRRNR